MAKTSSGGATTTTAKSAPSAAARKKARTAEVPPKKADSKKAGPKKAAPPTMAAAPKKVPAPGKAAATKRPAAKKLAGTAKAPRPGKAVARKAAPSNPAEPKAALPMKRAAKLVPLKKAATRRPATRPTVPTPAARRARTPVAPRKSATAPQRKTPAEVPPAKIGTSPPHHFTVSHVNEEDFKADGLRTYARYRDLGIAAATGGLCQAHVIRFTPPCTDEVRKRHVHQVDLQLVYVLQGWMKNEFDGHGEQMMSAGSCWLQPSGIKHTVLDYSPDCEVLEIIVPADFKTEEAT